MRPCKCCGKTIAKKNKEGLCLKCKNTFGVNAVKTYVAKVVVRPNSYTGPEHVFELTVSARHPHLARRLVIDAVLQEDKLVSHFQSVKQQRRKSK